MRRKTYVTFLCSVLVLPYMITPAFANSSWHWLTCTPLTVLPYAITGTIAIEVFAVSFFCKTGFFRTTVLVLLANALSFLAPYTFLGLVPEVFVEYHGFFPQLNYAMQKFPYYIVGGTFLVLTLLVEIPVVYFGLRGKAQNKKRLVLTILIANTVTTVCVAIVERLVCPGRW